jgi:hypothetical protein
MQNTAAKKRAAREDMDSDYLFDNFLQRPSFRFNEAFNYDNPAALAALYTEDAVLVVPGKPKSSG